MRAFDMGIFMRASGMVLDDRRSEGREEFSQFNEFEPGLATKLFPAIDGKYNGHHNAMTSEPGEHP
jgi:hypothetical protein